MDPRLAPRDPAAPSYAAQSTFRDSPGAGGHVAPRADDQPHAEPRLLVVACVCVRGAQTGGKLHGCCAGSGAVAWNGPSSRLLLSSAAYARKTARSTATLCPYSYTRRAPQAFVSCCAGMADDDQEQELLYDDEFAAGDEEEAVYDDGGPAADDAEEGRLLAGTGRVATLCDGERGPDDLTRPLAPFLLSWRWQGVRRACGGGRTAGGAPPRARHARTAQWATRRRCGPHGRCRDVWSWYQGTAEAAEGEQGRNDLGQQRCILSTASRTISTGFLWPTA